MFIRTDNNTTAIAANAVAVSDWLGQKSFGLKFWRQNPSTPPLRIKIFIFKSVTRILARVLSAPYNFYKWFVFFLDPGVGVGGGKVLPLFLPGSFFQWGGLGWWEISVSDRNCSVFLIIKISFISSCCAWLGVDVKNLGSSFDLCSLASGRAWYCPWHQ